MDCLTARQAKDYGMQATLWPHGSTQLNRRTAGGLDTCRGVS